MSSKVYDYLGNEIDVIGKVENSNILENMELTHCYDSAADTRYTIIRVFKQKIDGSYQYPFLRMATSGRTPYQERQFEGWDIIINAGMAGNATALTIENGVLITDTPGSDHPGRLPLLIDSNGDLSYYPSADTSGKGQEILNSGIVSAVVGWYPLIVDYDEFDYPTGIPGTDTHNWIIAQKQVLGQYANGDYCIITAMGRGYYGSVGFTVAQMQALCKKIGLKFAYMFDGGGSTQTMLGGKLLTPIYDGEGETGRNRPNFIVFNGKSTFSIPDSPA